MKRRENVQAPQRVALIFVRFSVRVGIEVSASGTRGRDDLRGRRFAYLIVPVYRSTSLTPSDMIPRHFPLTAHLRFRAPTAPPNTWPDIEPEIPNRTVNINDAFATVLAFKAHLIPLPTRRTACRQPRGGHE